MSTKSLLLGLTIAGLIVGCGHPKDEAITQHPAAQTETDLAVTEELAQPAAVPPVQMKMQAASSYGMPAPMSLRARIAPHEISIDRENYDQIDANTIKLTEENPVSTFSIDVDTGAYSNIRRILNQGRLPRHDAVRIEEMINYFSYNDPTPSDNKPFLVSSEIAPTPWNKDTHLLRLALKTEQIQIQDLPPSNLVFLLDVSGSMSAPDKLPLLKRSLNLLIPKLRAEDKVSIVVYAGASGVVLEPTNGDKHAVISQALEKLSAGGSTHGSAGIKLAYAKAKESFIKDGINRVILATDGDFNVGTINHEALINLIEKKREQGISLTTLGFGQGNYNDKLSEQLADHGNGNHAYIDNLLEAQKVLVEEMGGTLNTVAKDVKIQVEFNPANVREYRLIGYENRKIKREDFNNDKVDAGEIGAGHSVVALYEIALTDSQHGLIDQLRYQSAKAQTVAKGDELAFVKLRYKAPNGNKSQLMTFALNKAGIEKSLSASSNNLRFSAAVAAFGQKLRGGKYLSDFDYADISELARDSRGEDNKGYRSAFLQLVALADSLDKG